MTKPSSGTDAFLGAIDAVVHRLESELDGGSPFSDAAFTALASVDLKQSFDFASASAWFGAARGLPPQLDNTSSFGNPPVTVHANQARKFAVDVYFWLQNDTSIHDHTFTGAFQLVHGRILHSMHSFDETAADGSGFRQGRLKLEQLGAMTPGDTVKIVQGDAFIHQTSHLSHPTVTVCVRTFNDPGFISAYHPAGMAFDALALTGLPEVRKGVLYYDFLRNCRPDLAPAHFQTMVGNDRGEVAFGFLYSLIGRRHAAEDIEEGIERFAARHPAHGDLTRKHWHLTHSSTYLINRSGTPERETERARLLVAVFQLLGFGHRALAAWRIAGEADPCAFLAETLEEMVRAQTGDWRFPTLVYACLTEPEASLEDLYARYRLTPLEIRSVGMWKLDELQAAVQSAASASSRDDATPMPSSAVAAFADASNAS